MNRKLFQVTFIDKYQLLEQSRKVDMRNIFAEVVFSKVDTDNNFCQNSFSKVDMMIRYPAWSLLARDAAPHRIIPAR